MRRAPRSAVPSALRSALYSTSSMSVDLPEPDTPVMHTSRRSGTRTFTFLRLCCVTPRSLSDFCDGTMRAVAARCPPGTRRGAGARAAQPASRRTGTAGQRARIRAHRLGRVERDDLAAALARAGTEVEHPVGREHDLRIVLDDDQRVARVAQPLHDPRSRAACRADAGRSTARRARTACSPATCRARSSG